MKLSETEIYCKTDVGNKRPNNEDQCGILDKKNFKVVLVADGMGGHASGEVASKMAKETILQLLDLEDHFDSVHQIKSVVKKVIKKTNSIIHKQSANNQDFYGMGTTLVMAVILDEVTVVFNCGDSRCYTFAEGKITQVTTDQTVVQYLMTIGAITKEEMKTSPKRHVLMNAMGISPSIDCEILYIPSDYDGIMVCSDGLSNMVEDDELAEVFYDKQLNKSAKDVCNNLVDRALINGGVDNIAVALLEGKR